LLTAAAVGFSTSLPFIDNGDPPERRKAEKGGPCREGLGSRKGPDPFFFPESALREVLARELTLEVRTRIERILSNVPKVEGLGAYAHRQLRAVLLLEQIGTPECKTILERLAREAGNPTVKARAQEAVARLPQVPAKLSPTSSARPLSNPGVLQPTIHNQATIFAPL
jgi:hypothetical protein